MTRSTAITIGQKGPGVAVVLEALRAIAGSPAVPPSSASIDAASRMTNCSCVGHGPVILRGLP